MCLEKLAAKSEEHVANYHRRGVPFPALYMCASVRHDSRGFNLRRHGRSIASLHWWPRWIWSAPTQKGYNRKIGGGLFTTNLPWGFVFFLGWHARGGAGLGMRKRRAHGPWPRLRLGLTRSVNDVPFSFA